MGSSYIDSTTTRRICWEPQACCFFSISVRLALNILRRADSLTGDG